MQVRALLVTVSLALGLAACSREVPIEAPRPAEANTKPLSYDRQDAWLCRPDRPNDPCRTDLDATELRPDGKRVVMPFEPAANPRADCFYVYPTVDMGDVPGN